MTKKHSQASKTVGLAPGELVHIGEERHDAVTITVIDYDKTRFHEKIVSSVEDCFPYKETPSVTWINVDGIHDTGVIEKIGKRFDLHPLILEDIVNTGQRPKLEDYDKYLFIVLKMFYCSGEGQKTTAEQVSMILGPNFVISFQEIEGDVFDRVRDRIKNDKGRIRKMGADYLAYALMDAIIDNYFVIVEKIGERIEDLENTVVNSPTPRTLQEIYNLKKDMIFLRKSVWPLRELIGNMERGGSILISKTTHVFLRDIYDHTIQVADTIETSRDMASGMMDVYLSSVSNKMNEIMKVLTIIATIFIPITFIAGVYGMNFNPGASPLNMPELSWRYGYLFAWGVMIIMAVSMVVYFKRKKWL